MHSSSHRLGTPAINRASAWRMLTFKNSSALGTAFPSPGEFLEWERDHLCGFSPAAAAATHPASPKPRPERRLPCWCSSPGSHEVASGPPPGGPEELRAARPVAVPCSPTTGSWELAVGSGLAAGGGGWMLGLVWGFSLPGGPSWLCAEQTFRPDVGNMRNQFSGNSAAKPSTFGRETGSLSAPGAQCLPLKSQRGLLLVGPGQLGFGGGGGTQRLRQAPNSPALAWGFYSWGSTTSFVFS